MGKFMIATFLVLGWTFWEMSGGSDFVPEQRPVVVAEAPAEEESPSVQVTRAIPQDTLTLALPVANRNITKAAPETDAEVVLASITEAIETTIETPAPAAEPVVAAPAPEPAPVDLRYVSGNVVNMRGGPSTDFGVVDKLTLGTLTEVVEVRDGWARIIVPSTGLEGWMSDRYLER